jgi:lysozyme
MSDNNATPSSDSLEIHEGIDVSDAQGTIDWNAVAGAGIEFAYAKATDGKDPHASFKTNWVGAGAAGILRGAYHWFYPVPLGSDHLQKQVDAFLAQIGTLAANDLPPMIDVEQSLPLVNKSTGAVLFPAMAPQDIAASLTFWLEQVAEGCGRQPIIYTYPSYWQTMLGDSAAFHSFHLWIAQYGNPPTADSPERPPLGHAPTIPGGWAAFSIWQYAVLNGLPGVGTYVDRDQIILPTGTAIGDFLNGSPPNPSQTQT